MIDDRLGVSSLDAASLNPQLLFIDHVALAVVIVRVVRLYEEPDITVAFEASCAAMLNDVEPLDWDADVNCIDAEDIVEPWGIATFAYSRPERTLMCAPKPFVVYPR